MVPFLWISDVLLDERVTVQPSVKLQQMMHRNGKKRR